MYYPLQIPYMLDKEFLENIQYKEYKIDKLSDFCMCIWEMKSKNVVNDTIYNYILPDACIDIVVDFENKKIRFAGYSKGTIPFELNKNIDFMGARLKPGAIYCLFGINAETIIDTPIDFEKIDNTFDFTKILSSTETIDRLNFFKDYLLNKFRNCKNKNCINIIENLYKKPTEQTVKSISFEFGYSEKQLYRLFKKWYGISPKIVLNILRLHLCLTLLLNNKSDLANIAYDCGFYDQSHFIKEIKKYTGFSPLKLIERYK